ncbi:spectrin beta brain 4 (non-erythroid beta chain 4) (Beta-V spectrin) (BSPECV) [Schistosoma japonicum]|nr:spectrin beta brain 4 (non-erythroid beta chain 4) (Beta-V spectrin) (BSPECV) [Schistosoma japonicum]
MNPQKFLCRVCNVWCDTENVLRLHESGKKHRAKCLTLDSLNSAGRINYPLRVSLPAMTTPDSGSPKNSFLDTSFHSTGTMTSSICDPESSLDTSSILSGSKCAKSNQPSAALEGCFTCHMCGIELNSSEQYSAHLRGRKHQSKAAILENSAKGDEDCVLLLDSFDGRGRVGIHLANALLLANKSVSFTISSSISVPTCVVWVLPEIQTLSTGESSVVNFRPDGKGGNDERSLRIAFPPLDLKFLREVDLILTTTDLFVKHLSNFLMKQAFICGIIIDDVDIASKDEEFCGLLLRYLQQFTNPINRGRIICFTGTKVDNDSIFSLFALYS